MKGVPSMKGRRNDEYFDLGWGKYFVKIFIWKPSNNPQCSKRLSPNTTAVYMVCWSALCRQINFQTSVRQGSVLDSGSNLYNIENTNIKDLKYFRTDLLYLHYVVFVANSTQSTRLHN